MKKKVVEINQELQVLRNELKRTKTEQQGSLRESPCNKLKRDISLDVDIGETKPLKSETPKALNCS